MPIPRLVFIQQLDLMPLLHEKCSNGKLQRLYEEPELEIILCCTVLLEAFCITLF